MRVEVLLDLLIIALLVPTVVYAIVLNQRLKALRRSREDFGRLIIAFGDATTKAEVGTMKLRQYAESAGTALKESVDGSVRLRDDLAFMIERAEKIADRLEEATRAARDESLRRPAHSSAPAPAPNLQVISRPDSQDMRREKERAFQAVLNEIDEGDRSEVEKELIRALGSLKVSGQ
ncbi:hypothetical protein FACS1894186_0790 [Alphaproteobacteria bacterium]|nr:hypothetical protein FACS1894186_0790 [Alphaproteobacteria bacterium]